MACQHWLSVHASELPAQRCRASAGSQIGRGVADATPKLCTLAALKILWPLLALSGSQWSVSCSPGPQALSRPVVAGAGTARIRLLRRLTQASTAGVRALATGRRQGRVKTKCCTGSPCIWRSTVGTPERLSSPLRALCPSHHSMGARSLWCPVRNSTPFRTAEAQTQGGHRPGTQQTGASFQSAGKRFCQAWRLDPVLRICRTDCRIRLQCTCLPHFKLGRAGQPLETDLSVL